MADRSYDAVVVGAGPGGYVAAIRLAQLGKRTAVVEREAVGGVCLNHGCIPSKALIHAADLLWEARHAEHLGITVEGVRVDFARLREWRRSVVSRLTGGVAQLLKGNGVEVIRGTARLLAPGRLSVDTTEGPLEVEAGDVVLATGARPFQVQGLPFDGERILSAREALDLEAPPARLLVVGGGYIGLELGIAWARLGSAVTVVEAMDRLLPAMEPDLVKVVEKRMRALGIEVRTGARAGGAEVTAAGVQVRIETAAGVEDWAGDRVLVAVGMRPNTEDLGLESLGVERDRQGFIVVDPQRRTTAPRTWAIGDCAGGLLLAHKASREGVVAAEAIAGMDTAFTPAAVPWVVFTDPELAGAGLTEAEARARGMEVKTGRFFLAGVGKALAMDRTDGFARWVVDAATDRVVGFQMAGAGASDLVAEAVLALEQGITAEALGRVIHAHPTLAEVVAEAAEAVHGRAIHGPPARRRPGR